MKRVMLYIWLFVMVAVVIGACGEVPATEPPPTATPEPTDVPPTAEPTGEPAPTTEVNVYEDEFFTLEYPTGWQVVERAAQNTVIFVAPQTAAEDLFRENVGVTRQELDDPGTSVGTYTREFLDAAPGLIEGYALVTSEPARLSGQPAHRVIYGGTQNGVTLGWQQVWTIHDGNAYILTYTGDPVGFETFLDEANAIVESFTLK